MGNCLLFKIIKKHKTFNSCFKKRPISNTKNGADGPGQAGWWYSTEGYSYDDGQEGNNFWLFKILRPYSTRLYILP